METLYIDDLLARKEDCIDNTITVFTLQYLTLLFLMNLVYVDVGRSNTYILGR